jgi:hypothetical protein
MGLARKKWTDSVRIRDMIKDKKELQKLEQDFEKLRSALCEAPTLAFPDFKRPFILYVDACKEGFGVAVHQADENGKENPILFLSKTLSPAEKRYWPTELETAALIWALQKLPQYTDHGNLVVHIGHNAIKQSFKDQGPIKGRRSDRLINWRIFLAKFINRMEIIHRPGKEHKHADALSRLPIAPKQPEEVQNQDKSEETMVFVMKVKKGKLQNSAEAEGSRKPSRRSNRRRWKCESK